MTLGSNQVVRPSAAFAGEKPTLTAGQAEDARGFEEPRPQGAADLSVCLAEGEGASGPAHAAAGL